MGKGPTRAEVMGEGWQLKYHFYQVCFVWAKSLLGPSFCFSPDEREGVGKNELRQKTLEVKGFEIKWMWVQVLALLLTNQSLEVTHSHQNSVFSSVRYKTIVPLLE